MKRHFVQPRAMHNSEFTRSSQDLPLSARVVGRVVSCRLLINLFSNNIKGKGTQVLVHVDLRMGSTYTCT